jgi:hypothetical protein
VLTVFLGIDVQTELRTKEDSAPSSIPIPISQPTPVQRVVMDRHHQAQRANSGSGPRLIQTQKSRSNTVSSQSPQLQPTPPSQPSSPTASRPPVYGMQGGMPSPHTALQAQQQSQPPFRPQHPESRAVATRDDGRNSAGGIRSNHWSSSYQTHMEQLGKLTHLFLSLSYDRALFILD